MRKRATFPLGFFLVALVLSAAYVAWASYAGSKTGFGDDGLRSAWPYLLAGVMTVGAVIAGFVWLAFFSERRGYDDHIEPKH